MSPKNCKKIRERIVEAAKNLEGKLPDHPKHPKGRNPYAHIPKVIISIWGKSYKNISDKDLDLVFETIKYCEENPF